MLTHSREKNVDENLDKTLKIRSKKVFFENVD